MTSNLTRAALMATLLAGAAAVASAQSAASATLTLEPVKYDPQGSREAGMMYMPSSIELQADRPAGVQRAPDFQGKPRWGTLSIGSGEGSVRAIAVDESTEEARIYLDLNGNGDLTDDKTGDWPTKNTSEDGMVSYAGTWVFDVTWAEGDKTTKGKYGLNFYYSPDRDRINFYRAAARVGSIEIDGVKHTVTLVENDNDARYGKKFEADAVVFEGETMTKPVWLMIDGDRFDCRGTFQYGGVNYEPFVSDDGSELSIKPTFRVIAIPRPQEKRPEMLPTGASVPNFVAMHWNDKAGEEEQFEFAELARGKVVVLDLWATWCGPCKRGLPHLSRIAEQIKSDDVRIIALNVYDDEAAYRKFIAANDYAFEWARDPAGREKGASIAGNIFNVFAIPATYVIDRDGKVAAVISGYREGDHTLEASLEKLGVALN